MIFDYYNNSNIFLNFKNFIFKNKLNIILVLNKYLKSIVLVIYLSNYFIKLFN